MPSQRTGNTYPSWQINVNSWARDPYVKVLSEGLKTKAMPEAIEEATEAFAAACERFFRLFGSAGKAGV